MLTKDVDSVSLLQYYDNVLTTNPALLPGRTRGRRRILTGDREVELATRYFKNKEITQVIADDYGISRWWVKVVADRYLAELSDAERSKFLANLETQP